MFLRKPRLLIRNGSGQLDREAAAANVMQINWRFRGARLVWRQFVRVGRAARLLAARKNNLAAKLTGQRGGPAFHYEVSHERAAMCSLLQTGSLCNRAPIARAPFATEAGRR